MCSNRRQVKRVVEKGRIQEFSKSQAGDSIISKKENCFIKLEPFLVRL